ncbi:hypothetical protein ASG52_17140 [Methylobacterium sp. Leaf456]|nr:hypothetical protein ASG52_17140 [Methylobacterium sp. Leaf456]
MLLDQGFRPIAPCEQDAAIQRAWFTQEGGGPFGPFPMSAVVSWKVGPDGRIAWTKAVVDFTGL